MVSMPFTLTAAWTEENRYAAVDACEMLLSNTSASDLRWARTTGPAAPSITPLQAHLLHPGNSLSVPLAEGETLWVAGGPPGSAVADVFDRVAASDNMLVSRAALVSLAAASQGSEGEEVRAGGIGYVWSAGADAIPDMPGLKPANTVTLEHFGAQGDGVTG
ncbi:hypothetical protein LA6_006184 (plasmid) [Marinibacterium anthonyi]|nr:hypothetical protein LA6_006184 [Marinibacterium anthonyi]